MLLLTSQLSPILTSVINFLGKETNVKTNKQILLMHKVAEFLGLSCGSISCILEGKNTNTHSVTEVSSNQVL